MGRWMDTCMEGGGGGHAVRASRLLLPTASETEEGEWSGGVDTSGKGVGAA